VEQYARQRLPLISNSVIYFLVFTLEYLTKGGRIGGASALLGSVLQIKPILIFKDGRVNQFVDVLPAIVTHGGPGILVVVFFRS